MFGIGFTELLVIGVVALIFVGPARLPELMRQLGRYFVQARRMTSEVRSTIDSAIRDAEDELRREEIEKMRQLLTSASPQEGDSSVPIIDHHAPANQGELDSSAVPEGAEGLSLNSSTQEETSNASENWNTSTVQGHQSEAPADSGKPPLNTAAEDLQKS
jgi:sec-independent protein translocase protein TatB